MFLSDFSIKRPTATIVLILAMMCVGLLALKKLRVNQNPDVEVPFIVVNIPYPGASPETVEREIVNRLSTEVGRALRSNELRERLAAMGSEPVGTTPDEAAARIRREIARYTPVIKQAGIRAE